ncbi:MAG: hypothetical protein NE327_01030 [Lentisphaeraceae bacterium]|nr:hypothetical protein [Lentisphaeraceae bacterium]
MAKEPIPETAALEFVKAPLPSYSAVIALPSCNESENLPAVIGSLEQNPAEVTQKTLIVINANNRTDADNSDNLKTVSYLRNYDGPLNLSFLNSTAPPFSYPAKFGVGLARHQACTVALKYLNDRDPVISLDGDSPVNANYLSAIFNHIKENPNFGAGHVNFRHRHEGTNEEIEAIQLYDRHLKLHREGLQQAASPHAWYAIGSTIVCTKEAYLKSGGYSPRRMAGEDFYLLQQLSKVGFDIQMIQDAFVYPSNRKSDRVPFGTGKAVIDILEAGEWLTYNPQCYLILKRLLNTIYENNGKSSQDILKMVPVETVEWLESRSFESVWTKLQNNSKNSAALIQRFNEWLDAFQTLKLIHHLTENYFEKIKIEL